LKFSEIFKYALVWSLKSEYFICIEPWTFQADALNTGKELNNVDPLQTFEAFIEISIGT